MASSLPTEKLDQSNYTSWSYKMHQYLLGHDFWSYVEGANKVAPEPAHKDFPVWEQGASRVLYCLVSCVHDQMLCYIKHVILCTALRPMCTSDVGLHLRGKDVAGGLGKSGKGFCREYDGPEVAAPSRAQQYPTEGYDSHQLHHQKQRDLCCIVVHKCDGG